MNHLRALQNEEFRARRFLFFTSDYNSPIVTVGAFVTLCVALHLYVIGAMYWGGQHATSPRGGAIPTSQITTRRLPSTSPRALLAHGHRHSLGTRSMHDVALSAQGSERWVPLGSHIAPHGKDPLSPYPYPEARSSASGRADARSALTYLTISGSTCAALPVVVAAPLALVPLQDACGACPSGC